MKQTQINGETYVNCGDLVKWMLDQAKEASKESEPECKAAGKGIEILANILLDWATNPARKRGLINRNV